MEAPLYSLDRAFEELYTALPQILGQAFTERNNPQSNIFLVQQNQKKVAHELGVELTTLRQRCREGLRLILHQLETMQDPEVLTALPYLQQQLSEKFKSVLTSPIFTAIVLRVISGDTWREALRIPRTTLDVLYLGARAIFEDGRFQDAINCFAFLAWFDARQYDFWMALAHSQFHCALYDNAISSYGVAAHCCPEESWPHIYSARCYEALEDFEQASRCLRHGLDLEKRKPTADKGLITAVERNIDQYRHGSIPPIS